MDHTTIYYHGTMLIMTLHYIQNLTLNNISAVYIHNRSVHVTTTKSVYHIMILDHHVDTMKS